MATCTHCRQGYNTQRQPTLLLVVSPPERDHKKLEVCLMLLSLKAGNRYLSVVGPRPDIGQMQEQRHRSFGALRNSRHASMHRSLGSTVSCSTSWCCRTSNTQNFDISRCLEISHQACCCMRHLRNAGVEDRDVIFGALAHAQHDIQSLSRLPLALRMGPVQSCASWSAHPTCWWLGAEDPIPAWSLGAGFSNQRLATQQSGRDAA